MNGRRVLYGIAIAGLCAAGVWAFAGDVPFVDEMLHFAQIQNFYHGNWNLSNTLAMLPGYHLAVVVVARLLDAPSFPMARRVTALFGLLAIAAIYWAAAGISGSRAAHKTLRVLVVPFIFPFFFLVYTDAFALGLIAWALGLTARRRYGWAAAASFLSILARQTNIVWAALLFVWAYLQEEGARVDSAALKRHAKRGAGFLVLFAAFAIFVALNHGVTIGRPDFNPTGKISAGNLAMFLFLFGFFFLPECLRAVPALCGAAVRRPWAAGLVIAVAAAGAVFFRPDHRFNAETLLFFWRNQFLLRVFGSPVLIAAFFAAAAAAAGVLLCSQFREGRLKILYFAATLAFLLPQWVIEPRYAITPLAFYVLLREEEGSRAWRIAQIAWSGVWCVYFTWRISRGELFP